jgi:hypothetical protein
MSKTFRFTYTIETEHDELEAWDIFLDVLDECKAKDVFDCEEIEGE